MKSTLFALSVLSLAIVAKATFACPSFDMTPGTYTEINLGCTTDGQPDLNGDVAVNQADGRGGECRVLPRLGDRFIVRGKDLVVTGRNGEERPLGTLFSAPSCTQTDAGDDYLGNWIAVRLDTTP